MAEDRTARTEEPTPKRREEARAEGQVAQSVEVTSAAVLIAALLTLSQRGPEAVGALRAMMSRGLAAASTSDLTGAQIAQVMRGMVTDSVAVVGPVLLATAVVGVLATVAQIGFQVVPKR